MIQNTSNKPVSELFSGDNNVTYQIPRYQREYVWGKWNWESLFDDIDESERGHFLGSIICINTEKDSHKPATLEMVDGQQRMTTISLFYLAIFKFLNQNMPTFADDDEHMDEKLKIRGLKNRIIVGNSLRLTPSISNSNLEDYKWIFADNLKEITSGKKPKFMGLRKMAKAFSYFSDRLNREDEKGNPEYSYTSVMELMEKLNSATLVKIDVATHADAFTLFETLNNRGVPLSAIDLIKNKLLGQLEKEDKEDKLDENFDRWNRIISNLTDEYKVQERFLRQFYNAFRLNDEVAVPKIRKALRSNLIQIYEHLIEHDPHGIFDRLEDASEIYSMHVDYDNDENSKDLIRSLRNLENVNGVDGYMLLLFVTKRFDLSEDDKIQLIDLLCRYFIRRNVTDTPPTRDLTNYFMEIIESANQWEDYDWQKMHELIVTIGRPATDEKFKEKLNGDLYEENVGATRFILASLEAALSETKEKYVNFYERNKNIYIWTIEHIFPQGENIRDHWVQMIADGDKELASKIRKNCVHKLGNLTLTGYNSQLSNLSLLEKQNRKNKEGKFIGFKNQLALNEELKNAPKWTKDQIEIRTERLANKALEIFKI